MRIISGLYRGKTIVPPRNFRARPTTDFAKEALFNILANHFDFENTEVLDLFSGTGSIGIEFASRGASFVEMVEKNHIHAAFIQKTITELNIQDARVIKTDAFLYIARMERPFDIVFADPPYELEEIFSIPERLLDSRLLKEGGWIILEHGAAQNFKSISTCFDSRNYGSVHFSFFRK